MHKLSHLVGSEWLEHSFAPVYELPAEGDVERLRAGSPSGQSEPFERLSLCLEPPYLLLYVLHTPRGEGEPGRYQSGELSRDDFLVFMGWFGRYLATDARFDLWLHSPAENATVVWDRHNRLYAYGPLDRYAASLQALGFEAGRCTELGDHQHHYRPENDADAVKLLAWFDWHRSPLQPEDEQ